MATSPAPDAAAPPGMCPGIAVLGGGGGSGDGSGDGSGGEDGSGGDGNGNGEGGNGDGKGAGNCGQGGQGGCTRCHPHNSAGDPVDVATGEMFTVPHIDFALPGAVSVVFKRKYSTTASHLDLGLGYGWTHTLAWSLTVQRRRVSVRGAMGGVVEFDQAEEGRAALGTGGWVLVARQGKYHLDTNDGFTHEFTARSGRQFVLSAIIHRNQNRISIHRDGAGAITAVFDSVGRMLKFESTRSGRIASISIRDPSTKKTITHARYEYTPAGDLAAFTDADGHVTRYFYDEDHRLVRYTYPTGLTFYFRHDAEGRCVETWGDYQGKVDPALDEALPDHLADRETRARGIYHVRLTFGSGGYSELIDSARFQRFFARPDGRLDKAVGNGGVTTRIYDELENVASMTDAGGNETRYAWDLRGNLLRETDPLGRTFQILRDFNGLVVENVDTDGKTTKCLRDQHGNPIQIIDKAGRITAYEYDDHGQIAARIDPQGGRTTFKTDDLCNVVEMVRPDGARFRWVWDFFGRPIGRTDPKGNVTRYTYSDAGLLLTIESSAGRTMAFTYDGLGSILTQTDEGGTTEYAWGGLRWLYKTTFPNGEAVGSRYNYEGWLTKDINENGEVTEYVRNARGLVVLRRRSDGSELKMSYDAMHRRVVEENALGEMTVIERDAIGRITSVEYADRTAEAFEYDALDRVVAATGPGGKFTFEYDDVGNRIRESQIVAGEGHVVEGEFDAMRRRTRLATSLGHEEIIERDVVAKRTRVTLDGGYEVREERDELGFLKRQILPGGAIIENDHDGGARLTRRRVLAPAAARSAVGPGEPSWIGEERSPALIDKAYRYAKGDNLLQAFDNERGETRYVYDARDRLLRRWSDRGYDEGFHVDAASNIHERGRGAVEREYGPGNRLLRRGDTRYVWDVAGRLAEKRTPTPDGGEEVWRYAWNAQGLLRLVTRPDAARVAFAYDPFGRRVLKTVSVPDGDGALQRRVVTRFVWDGATLVHELREEFDGDAPRRLERTYCSTDTTFTPWTHRDTEWRADEKKTSPWFHYVGDIIDTPELLVTGNGVVACRLERTAWGRTTVSRGAATSTPVRFEGQYEDEETGLFYNLLRYYDPEVGRYISPDPIGVAGGNNLYAYCRNPIGFVDPFGLHELDCTLTLPPAREGEPPRVSRPEPTPGHANDQGGGFSSGSTWPGQRDSEGNSIPRAIPGTITPDRPHGVPTAKDLQHQGTAHTERQAIEWAEHHHQGNLAGGTMDMRGQLPPCPMCSNEMREFARRTGCRANYSWPTNQHITYDPNPAVASPRPRTTDPRTARFCNDYSDLKIRARAAAQADSPFLTPRPMRSADDRYQMEQSQMRRDGIHPDCHSNERDAQARVANAHAEPTSARRGLYW